ncbi:hypothetical protein ABPG72_005714 [Tetrahymena utriculariae]
MKFSVHLKALMRKNYILWKRNCCCSCLEVFLPVLLCCFFFLIRSQIQIDYLDQESFIDPYTPTKNYASDTPYVFATFLPDSTPVNEPVYNTPIPIKIKDCLHGKTSDFPDFRNGYVAMVDPGNLLQPLANIFMNYNKYKVKQYNSVQELSDYISGSEYNEDICFGVAVDSYQNNIFKYRLLFNTSDQNHLEVPNTLDPSSLTYVYQMIKDYFYPWRDYGFLTIQNWIDNIIFRNVANNQNMKIFSSITSMTIQKYGNDPLSTTLKGNFAVYVVLPMILVYLRMTYGLLIEKEKKIREGMKVMGMSDVSFYVSWVLYYFIIYVLISLLVASVLRGSIFKHTDWSVLFVWHLLFGISLIFQSLFITTFFTKARVGNIVAMVFFLFQYMVVFIVQGNTDPSQQTKVSTSILSHTGTTFACDVYLLIEAQQKGITWSNLGQTIDNYSISINMGMNILNIFIFIILSIYFDQVFPNDFGKKQHPLFFINWIWRKKLTPEQKRQKLLGKVNDEEAALNFDENVEDVAKNLKDQEALNQVVTLKNVRKVYSSGKLAVNGISLTMYNGQIFALLGHNGAGKTSTISMLTGMYEMTDGQAIALGKDVQQEMTDIRTFMGVCPQYDILFDNLTVKEHLELFAVFKGMTDSKLIEQEALKHIQDVDLAEKTNELARNLSGGQRRRLSVAIAFIGGSKLIYLDEPTSGMDTSARRHIWDMLKRYKNDKVICLTTHFMDEADYLGDRIGIMADGKIVCLGRPLFLKNRFGTGYNLTIVKKNPTDNSQPIKEFIQKFIPQAKILSDVSAEIGFQLKNESISAFPQLFNSLDQNLQQLNIQSYGISITTLEEVFLRVAHLKDEKKEKLRLEQLHLEKKRFSVEQQKIEDETMNEADNIDFQKIRITNSSKLFFIHVWAQIIKRVIYFKRDVRSLLCEVVLPCLVVVFGLSLTLIKFIQESPAVELVPGNFPNPLNAVVSKDPSITSQVADGIFGSFVDNTFYNLDKPYQTCTTPKLWDSEVFNQKNTDSVLGYFINSVSPTTFMYTAEINTIYRDAAPFAMNQMNNAIINYYLKQNSLPTITITVTNDPLPLTKQIKSFEGSATGIVASFIYAIAYSFIPASIITFTVKERTDKIKHQQLVSGVGLFSYWFSNYLIDMVKHIVPAVFAICMVYAYNISAFTDDDCMGAVVLLLFLYGWSVIPFTYFIGFFFEDYGNAQVAAFFINFMAGGIFPLIIFILRIIKSTRNAGIIVGWILRIIPSFSFGYGILNIGNRNLYAFFDGSKTPQSAFSMDISGGDLILTFFEGFFYFFLVFAIEIGSHVGSISRLISNEASVPYVPKEYDEDVQKEITRVENSNPSDFTVRVNKLRKVFIPNKDRIKVAVDQVSFGISNGECFTLLGVNGAGKTTTFKILSGEINQTSGECHINGYDVSKELSQARTHIGYCPQFDALIENLTAREHLELYAAIKGIPFELRERLVKQKIVEMDLTEFEHKLAGTYSGGNKRKLSVAIAMLGNPETVFLDEPSTGMDPAARRFMWSVISRISTKRKASSVILTTHSMEEAEALSSRIAIQVEGILKCIGTVQQIKDKFGEGYEVEVKLTVPSDDDLIRYLSSLGINEQEAQKHIQFNELYSYLQRLNGMHYQEKIQANGEGSQLYARLNSSFGVSILSLAQYVILETHGDVVKQFIKQNLGDFTIIEHFDDFYRFRIESEISIGKMFELFEQNKAKLQVDNYSVKQATIEQIFNLFATNSIPLNFKKKGNHNYYNHQQPQQNIIQENSHQIELTHVNKHEGYNPQQQQIHVQEKYIANSDSMQTPPNNEANTINIKGFEHHINDEYFKQNQKQ